MLRACTAGNVRMAFPCMQDARNMRKRMEDSGMSVAEINGSISAISALSVIPYADLVKIALILHYCLNHEKLDRDRVCFFATISDHETKEEKPETDENHTGIWEAEQEFVSMIMQGSMNALTMPRQLAGISDGMRMNTKDSLRKAKDNLIVLLTIVSRAAIRGGLSPAVSYTLNDQYGTLIEQQKSLSDVSSLSEKMLSDYVTRLHRQKLQNGFSMPVLDACDWILMHIEEEISIRQVAEREGYTPYYFSRLFKEQMGISLSAWIRKQKILFAGELLKNTNLSVDEINARIHFGSREYFSSSFHKETGFSPSGFRKQKETPDGL